MAIEQGVQFLKAKAFMKSYRPSEYHTNWAGMMASPAFRSGNPTAQDLSKDIAKHGVHDPVLVHPEGYVVNGHHRVVAAGWAKAEVPYQEVPDPEYYQSQVAKAKSARPGRLIE